MGAEMKRFLVTGSSRGLGLSIAALLAEYDYHVIMLARPSPHFDEAFQHLNNQFKHVSKLDCDLSDRIEISRVVKQIIDNNNRLDGIVFNAGIIHPISPMHETNDTQWEENIHVNLLSIQQMTKGLMPLLMSTERTRITTISSGAAIRPIHSWSAYCVAKAGLEMWTKCLAEEYQTHNISAISVAPGIVDTGMQEDIRNSNPNKFPSHAQFVDFFQTGALSSSDDVATKLMHLVTEHTMNQSGSRYDVRDL
ncbi:MAG: hypothetical protein CMA25_06255 [Euryarchaeota archaeon]|nr:hypothetical protein [Euryarchaeota archaeon]|tara:strand:+ start:2488 stop:3240 length:753 start_codon:yes stop_codon:yes gene_type:complete